MRDVKDKRNSSNARARINKEAHAQRYPDVTYGNDVSAIEVWISVLFRCLKCNLAMKMWRGKNV